MHYHHVDTLEVILAEGDLSFRNERFVERTRFSLSKVAIEWSASQTEVNMN